MLGTPGGTRTPNLLIRKSPSAVHRSPQPSTRIHTGWLPTWLPGTYIVNIVTTWRCHALMTKRTAVRLPQDLADEAEPIRSVIVLIFFPSRAKRLLERDRELLERLAR